MSTRTTRSGYYQGLVPGDTIPAFAPAETIFGTDTTTAPATTRITFPEPGGATVDLYTTSISDAAVAGGFRVSTVSSTLTANPEMSTSTSTSRGTGAARQSAMDDADPTTESTTRAPSGTMASSASNASTTSTQTQQPPSLASGSHNSNNVSNGALAGAVVGSIMATALITLLLTILFIRHRQRQQSKAGGLGSNSIWTSDPVSEPGLVLAQEKQTPNTTTGFDTLIAGITPQPADEDTVRSRILTLFDQVALHVDNYYVPGSTPAYLSDDALARLERYNSGYLPAAIGKMLGQRSIRRPVITHALIYTLLYAIRPVGRAQGQGAEAGALLPRVFAAQPEIRESSSSTDSALFTWRMLTAYLHTHSASASKERTPLPTAESLATAFTIAFTPYSFPSFTAEERTAHLTTLANSASELGLWLFGQPCTFEIVWERSGGAFSVMPGVYKTVDERGVRLEGWVELVEGERVLYPAPARGEA
ncbi:uncharacterized protein DSM5745_09849 [Aspergillus mulundensis]|uniref:Uncharacterized protein n=1 Tax=Aspergillus mulundensis TaxID=1810919 RepID=A0A3D8QRY6_9EURO|nr:hypothetical protein DSM5745_09849 [Aspergillus mulundensis]RDW64438.1 hypothetical protein DSM5745_09849 [Aspergillus mulundensis]